MDEPGQSSTAQHAEDGANKQFESEEFRLYCYKILPCSKRYSHDWSQCPYAHPSERAKRRDFRIYKYDCIMCPFVERGEECPKGLNCSHSHNAFESWLHPQKYRTLICKDRDSCSRAVCFFAHGSHDLRMPCEPEPPAPPTAQLHDAAGRYLGPNATVLMSNSGCYHYPAGRCSADYSSSSNSSLQVPYVNAAPAGTVTPANCGTMFCSGACVMSPAELRSPEQMTVLPSGLLHPMNRMQQVQQLPTQGQVPSAMQVPQHLTGQQQQPVTVTSALLMPAAARAAVVEAPQVAGQLRAAVTVLQPPQVTASSLMGPAQQPGLQPCQQQMLLAQQHQLQQAGLLQSQQLQQQLQQLQMQQTQLCRNVLAGGMIPAADANTLGWVAGCHAAPQQAQVVISSSYDVMSNPNLVINPTGAAAAGCSIIPSVNARPGLDQCNLWPPAAGGGALDAQALSPTASASVSSNISAGQALMQSIHGGSPQVVGSPGALGLATDPFAPRSSYSNLLAAAAAGAPLMQHQPPQLPSASLPGVPQLQQQQQQLLMMNTVAQQGLGLGSFADAAGPLQQLGSNLMMHGDQLTGLLPQLHQLSGNKWDVMVPLGSAGTISVPATQQNALLQQQQMGNTGSLMLQQQQQQQQQQLLAQGTLRGLTPISTGITLLG